MDAAEFVSALAALLWPVVVAAVVFVLLPVIRRMIKRQSLC
jgi:hypothetical protein